MRFFWVSFFLFVLLPGYCLRGEDDAEEKKESVVNSVLASVNGEAITLSDVLPATRQKEYQAYAVYSGDQLFEEIREIRRRAAEELIDRKVLLEAYREEPFELPALDVESELDNTAERMGYRSRGEFIRYAREAGSSIEKIRKEIEEYMIVQIMLYRKIRVEENITPRDVYEYYKANPEKFVVPERLELAMILLAPDRPDAEETAKRIEERLKEDPDSFAELARVYSGGPAAADGGVLGEIERGRLRPEFTAAIPEPEPGRVYGPVQTTDGICFLKVISHSAEKKSEFCELIPSIRKRLEEESRAGIRRRYLESLRERAVIRLFF